MKILAVIAIAAAAVSESAVANVAPIPAEVVATTSDADKDAVKEQFGRLIAELNKAPEKDRKEMMGKFVAEFAKRPEALKALDAIAGESLITLSSPTRNEELYLLYIESREAYPFDNEADAIRLQATRNDLMHNRVGHKAADMELLLADGTLESLLKLSGERNYVLFFDPECETCRLAIERLRSDKHLNEGIASGKFSFTAVCTGCDEDTWRESVSEMPGNWRNVYDRGLIDEEELYVLPQVPIIYLLDAQGTVLGKDLLPFSLPYLHQ